jgi:hypothetical protein
MFQQTFTKELTLSQVQLDAAQKTIDLLNQGDFKFELMEGTIEILRAFMRTEKHPFAICSDFHESIVIPLGSGTCAFIRDNARDWQIAMDIYFETLAKGSDLRRINFQLIGEDDRDLAMVVVRAIQPLFPDPNSRFYVFCRQRYVVIRIGGNSKLKFKICVVVSKTETGYRVTWGPSKQFLGSSDEATEKIWELISSVVKLEELDRISKAERLHRQKYRLANCQATYRVLEDLQRPEMSFSLGKAGAKNAPENTLAISYKALKGAGRHGYKFALYMKPVKAGDFNLEWVKQHLNKVLHMLWRLDHGNLNEKVTLENVKTGIFDDHIIIDDSFSKLDPKTKLLSVKVLVDDSNIFFKAAP